MNGQLHHSTQNLYCIVRKALPDSSHFQLLIVCSIQVLMGKAWEILSRVVMSGRQMVDTQGAVPDERSQSPLCMSVQVLDARVFTRQNQYRLSFTIPGIDG